jgi:hypothetical protein
MASEKNFSLKKSFFAGDEEELLLLAKKTGGRGVLVLTAEGLKLRPRALNELTPQIAVPGWTEAWDWITSQTAP